MGGATKIHPAAKVAVKMLGVKTAGELAQIIAAVGLAQNMAAMRALATEGIQRGHMSLHARNLAATAGATGELLEKIVKQMVSEKNVRLEYAQELVKQYQKMLSMDDVDLEFTPEALQAIAKEALRRNTGARGLRSIIERIMLDVMFDVPSRDDVAKCIVTEKCVKEGAEPDLVLKEAK